MREALPDDPNMFVYLNNLGVVAGRLFENSASYYYPDMFSQLHGLPCDVGMFFKTNAAEQLDEAISATKKAIAAAPTEHPIQIRFTCNLSHPLVSRFHVTKNIGDLARAISSVSSARDESLSLGLRASCDATLGRALRSRYMSSATLGDLDEAILLLTTAFDGEDPDNATRATRLHELAYALY